MYILYIVYLYNIYAVLLISMLIKTFRHTVVRIAYNIHICILVYLLFCKLYVVLFIFHTNI